MSDLYGIIKVLGDYYKLYQSSKNNKELYKVAYNKAAKEMLWFYSEKIDSNNEELPSRTNRLVRQKYWSKQAFEANEQNKKWKPAFEHVVPLNEVLTKLESLYQENISYKNIAKIMEKLLVICIVTEEEDKRLGKKCKSTLHAELLPENVWNRYLMTEIEVYEIKTTSQGRKYLMEKVEQITGPF